MFAKYKPQIHYSEKELLNILRVPPSERRTVNKYIESTKLICKALKDSSLSAKEFERMLRKLQN